MATSAAVGALPDDLLLDIFSRLSLDPVDLLRCAATCTRWLRLVAANRAAFLRRAGVLPPESKNAAILLGAFYQNEYPVAPRSPATSNKISDCSPRFWRLDDLTRPGSGLLSRHGGLFNYAKPLASMDGLLLVRLMPPPLDYGKLHLAVCHPLLGGVHHVPLPPVRLHPPFLGRDLTGYALLTGYGGEGLDSHLQRRLAFRVLFTAVHLDGVVCACSYSSTTGSWSALTMCPKQMRDLTMTGPRAGVVDGGGTAHWLYRDETSFYTLDVSADAAFISLNKVPFLQVEAGGQPPFPCTAEGGKVLLFLAGGRQQTNNIPIPTAKPDQDENSEGYWIHYELPMLERPYNVIGFAESKGALLIKSFSGLFSLGLESKEVEHVRGSNRSTYPREVCSSSMCQGYNSCTQCEFNNCVLYEMDWSSYLLHLPAWSLRGATS